MIGNTEALLSGNFYKTLLDSIFDAVYVVDVQGNIMYWNDSTARITGYSLDEMIGHKFAHASFNSQSDHPLEKSDHQGLAIVLETGMPGTWKGTITS